MEIWRRKNPLGTQASELIEKTVLPVDLHRGIGYAQFLASAFLVTQLAGLVLHFLSYVFREQYACLLLIVCIYMFVCV